MAIEATPGPRSGPVRPLPEHPLHPLYRWRDHLTYVCRVFPEVPRMAHLARFSQLALLGVSACFSGLLSNYCQLSVPRSPTSSEAEAPCGGQTSDLLCSPGLEVYEIVRGCFLIDGGGVDLRPRSITMAPSNHSSNRLGLALEDRLHTAVLYVPNPTTQAQLLSLALQRIPECPFLHDTAGDEDVRP
jgi:hypothetical protein